jgi:4-hydroxybenzoate polyprenyltransferase/GT2 family glycosyltransferase
MPGLDMNAWRRPLEGLGIGRPGTWIVSALPFLVTALWAKGGLDLAIVLGTIYFVGPYPLLLHGYDAIHGSGGSAQTPSDGAAGAAPSSAAVGADGERRIRLVIALTNVPVLAILVLVGGAQAGVALLLSVAVAVAWSEPPLRTRDRPMLDVVSGAALVILPALAGFLIGGLGFSDVPWVALVAFAGWAVASCAMLAIRDRATVATAGGQSIATVLGPRWTSVIALVGYGLAAALAATSGRVGALAALGLDLFLLLPAMLLLARRDDPAAQERAAGRAWAGFVGLTDLVGVWLVVLWIRVTALRGMDGWEIAAVVAATVTGYTLLNLAAIRVTSRRRGTQAVAPDDVPTLTVIVPCHDVADRLPDVLAALLDQTYADTSILVVDEGSSDATAELAAAWLGETGRVMTAPPPPDGWSTRAWASQAGADASTTDLLLFADPDTIAVPVAIRLLVEQLQARHLDLLSGLTRLGMSTRPERIIVPGHPLRLFGFVPIWLSGRIIARRPRGAFASASMLLVRREAYVTAGGHGAVASSELDDVELARAVAASGGRIGTMHAADLAISRTYPDGEAAFTAWRRTYLPSVDGSLAVAIAMIVLETMAWIVPVLLPVLAWLAEAEPRQLLASFAPSALLVAMRIALAVGERHPASTVLWHPVTAPLTVIGQLAAIVDHVVGRPVGSPGHPVAAHDAPPEPDAETPPAG